MEHKESSGCQSPEGPILCINNCGFFGSATTMNMCSKCHKEMVLKHQQAKLAASLLNGSESGKDAAEIYGSSEIALSQIELKSTTPHQALVVAGPINVNGSITSAAKEKDGPRRCAACKKRVGLTGFECRCGGLFCAAHRYSDKHECLFDYRSAAQEAIAKANPVVKADKLDKI